MSEETEKEKGILEQNIEDIKSEEGGQVINRLSKIGQGVAALSFVVNAAFDNTSGMVASLGGYIFCRDAASYIRVKYFDK